MLLEHHDADLGSFAGPGIVPKFSETPGEVRWSGPWEVGAHNHEVYGELLGLSEVQIDDLRREGVV
jgi:formyl-CoA transferase